MAMSKSQRARAVLKRNTKKKRQGGRQLYGIKQGVGQITNAAFPKRNRRRQGKRGMSLCNALNAMHPCHLPLPRAVGAYTVIRTTDIVNTAREAVFFGTFKGPASQFTDTAWLTDVAVCNPPDGVELPIVDTSGLGNAVFFPSAALGEASLNGARMVPAAITVQIMNGDSLQNSTGIVYIGRSKTVLDLMGAGRTWKQIMEELVSYSAPRLCSAGKLALRGVQVNAIPNNMSVLSDFVPRRGSAAGRQIWSEANYAADFEGFGPIFVYNPDNVQLKYLVTIEWRMRFDPLNPAYAGHSMHKPATESTWNQVIGEAEALGNGVKDIADVIGDVGMAALPFVAAMGGA
jgi:hypothetical protein